ncbi:MAG: nucleotide-binding protein [Desulfurellaceae bacterium]|nr:nucleotide-binding protein [Desulfurellaceae bacterium]
MARPTKAKAIERLQKALDAIPELMQLEDYSAEFTTWQRNTEVALANTFGDKSRHIQDFTESISSYHLRSSLEPATSVLQSMIGEIEEYWEDGHLTPPSSAAQEEERTNTKEVFVIHGRDNEAKETAARFLEKLGLTPVILHEQPNQGRTIIEKFEQHAQVGFAVALLTPDDMGALKNDEKNLKPRARQNVVFELGYFLGRLGRKRVCALTKGNVEIPSDYDGVVYIPLDDSEGWKIKLIKELKNAGFDVDANKAL